MEKKFICAVLCFNNEKIIQTLINDLNSHDKLKDIKKIFIDDASVDATYDILKSNNLDIVRHNNNLGYGCAVKSAFKYASQNEYEYLFIFPGDYQRSIEDLVVMMELSKKNEYDLISGSKFNKIKLLPRHRKIGNLFYSNLAKLFWNSSLEDVLSGFKLYKVKKFIGIIENLPNNYSFDIVMNLVISKKNFKCFEFDADVKYNDQTSKMKSMFYFGKKNILLIGINMFLSIIFEFFKLIFNKK
jgi:hypothetical protein